MAAPNIVNVATILGKTFGNVLTSSNAIIISNGSSSGNVIKVNSIIVSNITTQYNANASIEYNTAAAGNGTMTRIIANVVVPPSASLVVTDKSTAFYMEENTCIKGVATASSNLEVIVSYEIIS